VIIKLNILIGCERSGRVRDEFQKRGHNAWSCDLAPSEVPGPHIQGNLLDHLDGCHRGHGLPPAPWDLLIFHADCTYLANSGVLRLVRGKLGVKEWLNRGQPMDQFNAERFEKMMKAAEFFRDVWNCDIAKIVAENPVMHGYGKWAIGIGDPTQTIQPYEYGHPESKRTCLWIKGLPKLRSTNILPLPECGHWDNQTPTGQNKLGPSPTRKIDRARTYPGIAAAMAEQWSRAILAEPGVFGSVA
jgi:hypothetical protein